MSTPSGKLSHPIELSAYLVRKANERENTQPDPVESDNDPHRSPYAPKRTQHRAGTPPNFVKNDLDAVTSAYALKRTTEAPSIEPDAAVRTDADPLDPVRRRTMGRPRTQLANVAKRSLMTSILRGLKPACVGCSGDRWLPCGSLMLLIYLLPAPGPLPSMSSLALTAAKG
jgi:hypothetical protein